MHLDGNDDKFSVPCFKHGDSSILTHGHSLCPSSEVVCLCLVHNAFFLQLFVNIAFYFAYKNSVLHDTSFKNWIRVQPKTQLLLPVACMLINFKFIRLCFSGFFKMISPFIDPVTRAKINFVTGSPASQSATLAETFELSAWEAHLGGGAPRTAWDADAYFA